MMEKHKITDQKDDTPLSDGQYACDPIFLIQSQIIQDEFVHRAANAADGSPHDADPETCRRTISHITPSVYLK